MTRLAPRFATPVSTILLGLLAACASNPVGNSSGSSSGGGGSSGTSGGTTTGSGTSGAGTSGAGTTSGGTTSGTGATGGSADGGVNAPAFCRVPSTVDAGSLPFVVDTAYVPSGWMGDAPAYMAVPANPSLGTAASPATTARMTLTPTMYGTIGDACTPDGVGRSPNPQGACWKVVFVPFPKTIQPGSTPGTTKIGGGPGYGWAGAFWQYPKNNWGTVGGGYPIPTGANTVSFWAKGTAGGEKVRFFTGEGLNTPCSDFVATTSTNATFPTTPAWTHYTIDITSLQYGTAGITPGQGSGGYFGGVLGAFGFGVGDQTLPSLDGGSAPPNMTDLDAAPVSDPAVADASFPPFFDSTVTFYIDDIEWQLTDGGM
jgi:hypothetical protein